MASFNIVFMGAEQHSHKNLLEAEGETNVGVSFWGLKRRLPKTKEYLFEDRMPASFEIFLDSGGYSANKTPTGLEELEEYAATYEAFVAANIDRVSLVTEFDCLALGPEWLEEQRQTFWADVPQEKFVPVWHGDKGTLPELDRLAAEYLNVGIPESALENHTNLAIRINNLQSKYGTAFHALACAKPGNLHAVRFDTAATSSWLSPMKYGETIVWDPGTNQLHRYTRAQKKQARTRHKNLFERAGFDVEKILDDDPTEVARLTLWSFRQLEAHVDKRRPPISNNPFSIIQGGLSNDHEGEDEDVADISEGGPTSPFTDLPPDDADTFSRPVSTPPSLVPTTRAPHERVLLPILGVKQAGVVEPDADGIGGSEGVPTVMRGSGSARLCNTCYVQATCPAFLAGSNCAFDLPVEIKTKEQIESVLNAMTEMQVARAFFGVYGEQLEGVMADPNVSQEMDRAMRFMKTRKEVLDNSSYVKVSMEARGQSGILSRVFGHEAVESRSDQGRITNRADRMLDTGIIDAEIVE